MAKAIVLTAAINVFGLAGSFGVLALYDVVLPGRSISGWAWLALAMGGIAAVCLWLEIGRGRVLSRTGAALERNLRWRVFKAVRLVPVKLRGVCSPGQPVRDMEQVRACLSGASVAART